jgi:hypothetical protein
MFATVLEAVEEIKAGRMVVVVDDEDRENEGDLTLAAEFVTPEAINFMAKFGRGLICLTLTEERADYLRLGPMTRTILRVLGRPLQRVLRPARVSRRASRRRTGHIRSGWRSIRLRRRRILRGRVTCFRCGHARVECWCGRDRRRLRLTWHGWRDLFRQE